MLTNNDVTFSPVEENIYFVNHQTKLDVVGDAPSSVLLSCVSKVLLKTNDFLYFICRNRFNKSNCKFKIKSTINLGLG